MYFLAAYRVGRTVSASSEISSQYRYLKTQTRNTYHVSHSSVSLALLNILSSNTSTGSCRLVSYLAIFGIPGPDHNYFCVFNQAFAEYHKTAERINVKFRTLIVEFPGHIYAAGSV